MSADQFDIEYLARALSAANDLIYDWDLKSGELRWFGAVAEVLNLDPDAVPATIEAFKGRINPQDLPTRMLAISDHLVDGKEYDSEYRVRQGDGSFCWVHERGSAELNDAGHPVRFTGVLRVIDKRKQHEAHLELLANYDELTGFYNRKRLRESFEESLEQARRYGQAGAFMVVSIDQFGVLNETYGYAAMDSLLVAAGQRVESMLRAADIVGRIASDSFGVIVTRCPDEAALRQIQEKILSGFRAMPLETTGGAIAVSVSVGAVMFGSFGSTAHDCIAKAELALQRARLRGCNRAETYIWSEPSIRAHRANAEICERVMEALREDRMLFAFQPVVSSADHAVSFYEALIRMRSPEGDIVPASEFMPAVEGLGLHRMIDLQTLSLAVKELSRAPELTLAINVSSLTLSDRSWLRRLVSKLRHRRGIAERLIIEITETAAMLDMEESVRFVSQVRDLGCRVAIDDFGAGYTSFRQLRSLTVDLLKIDGSYIRDIARSESNQLFVRTLLDLAQGFDLDTVAEFIEGPEEAEILSKLGVTYMQGYHFGRPVTERPWQKPATGKTPRGAGPVAQVAG